MKIVDQAPISIRLFGSGGAFGYYGMFRLTNGEIAQLYCTRLDQVVIIRTEKSIYIISPDNPEDFCRAMEK